MWAKFCEFESGRLFVASNNVNSSDVTLLVAPFADEMNKSRGTMRLICESCHQLAVLPDFYGTGDSEGEFGSASIETWLKNLDELSADFQARSLRLRNVIGIRFGCLLAAQWLESRSLDIDKLVLCQPILDGSQYLKQMFRLALATSLSNGTQINIDYLRDKLARGESVTCGGYEIAASMAMEMEVLNLETSLESIDAEIYLAEVSNDSEGRLNRINQGLFEAITARNKHSIATTVAGDPFWMATEIVSNELLANQISSWINQS
jgi:exosortase A-associated hydrolase 2